MHFAAVCLQDGANTIQAKPIMAVTDFSKRFASPIFGGQFKSDLWLPKRKEEPVLVDPRLRSKRTLAAVVPECVGKKLHDRLLQKLRIDIQHRVARLYVPADLGALVREFLRDFLAQVLDKIGRAVRDQVGFDLTQPPETCCKVDVSPEIISRRRLTSPLRFASPSNSLI